jgi:aldose 1-epimerase
MQNTTVKSSCKPFGNYKGQPVFLLKLENKHGNYVELITYGGIVKSIMVPDNNGLLENVVLGYDTLQAYIDDRSYIGATVGRFANRIANAAFTIDAMTYYLDQNDRGNNNHSGHEAFHNKAYNFTMEGDTVVLTASSPDGEGGFPGTVNLQLTYRWTDDNELIINFRAVTDKATPVNFTNHAYFNLNAVKRHSKAHQLAIRGESVLETTEDDVPTGKIVPAGNIAFNGESIQDRIYEGRGINSYYIFTNDVTLSTAACKLADAESGRVMEVFTTAPGVQVYTGDYLNGETEGSHGKPYGPFEGLCLECQFYPDSPNHDSFPTTILRPGETYNQSIIYKFSTQ